MLLVRPLASGLIGSAIAITIGVMIYMAACVVLRIEEAIDVVRLVKVRLFGTADESR